jgi:hypothetical protein
MIEVDCEENTVPASISAQAELRPTNEFCAYFGKERFFRAQNETMFVLDAGGETDGNYILFGRSSWALQSIRRKAYLNRESETPKVGRQLTE